jgi:hypothetical protein
MDRPTRPTPGMPSGSNVPPSRPMQPVGSARVNEQATPPVDPNSICKELDVLIRARYPIVYVVSWEEDRVEQELINIAKLRNKKLFIWTLTQGLVRHGTGTATSKAGGTTDPVQAINAVLDQMEPAIFLFKDFHPFMEENRVNLAVIRRLRDASHYLRDTYKTIIIVAPTVTIAPELSKDVNLFEYGLPGVSEFNALLDRIIDDVKGNSRFRVDLEQADREKLVQAARGLTLREAENVFAKTIVNDGKLDASDISVVFSEKQQIIRKSGLLEYYESQEDMGSVAGLGQLKTWLQTRGLAFTDKAVEFGLPAPKGVLLLGVQGCGKSLTAKAAANMWRMPLLRLDIGRMFGSLVGSSEENMRRAIQTAESIAPAILWVDEIDKAFSGATESGGQDGGTSSRVFSTFLTWLSEKKSNVFVIATANNIQQLPPELLRKGRLDDIFFVDLPNENERASVFEIHLKRRKRDAKNFELQELARITEGFSGAEIEEAVIAGLFDAFSVGSDLTQEILCNSIYSTVPLSRTMSEELARLRKWAAGRARLASGDMEVETNNRRKLEL